MSSSFSFLYAFHAALTSLFILMRSSLRISITLVLFSIVVFLVKFSSFFFWLLKCLSLMDEFPDWFFYLLIYSPEVDTFNDCSLSFSFSLCSLASSSASFIFWSFTRSIWTASSFALTKSSSSCSFFFCSITSEISLFLMVSYKNLWALKFAIKKNYFGKPFHSGTFFATKGINVLMVSTFYESSSGSNSYNSR